MWKATASMAALGGVCMEGCVYEGFSPRSSTFSFEGSQACSGSTH